MQRRFETPTLRQTYWQKFVETADRHNDPGKFTTLYAFEWTSIPNGQNMHRNVFFKDKPPAVTFSSFDSLYREDLWTYLEVHRNSGINTSAIPHNPLLFARRRVRWIRAVSQPDRAAHSGQD